MRRIFFGFAGFVGLLGIPSVVSAQLFPFLIPPSGMIADCSFITGDFHFHCLPLYLAYLIQLVFSFLGTICLIVIIWSGFEWAFSGLQGDSTNAKKRLRNAILGYIFAVLSYLIVDTIVSALLA